MRTIYGAGLVLALASGGCWSNTWKTRSQHQRDFAAEALMPSAGAESATPGRKVRAKLRIEVLVDAGFRSLPEWRREVAAQIDQASQLLLREVGVELEMTGVRNWDRTGGSDVMHDALGELETIPPGRGVDLVLGMITPLPLVTSTIHHIGMTRWMGRHIVVRGMDDVRELLFLRDHFDALGDNERFDIYLTRKRHKQAVVLTHEIAHAMGLIHVTDSSLIMHPSWDVTRIGFGKEEIDLFHHGLAFHARRMRPGQDPRPIELEWHAARFDRLRKSTWTAWDSGERQRLLDAGQPDDGAPEAAKVPDPATPAPSAKKPSPGLVGAVVPPPLPSLAPRPPPATGGHPEIRAELARGAVSRAERALLRAGDGPEVAALRREIAQLRGDGSMPPGAVPEAAEGAYLALVRAGIVAAYAGDAERAEAQAAKIERAHPSTAGAHAVRCVAAYQASADAIARTACAAALERDPASTHPRYIQALVRAAAGARREAETMLTALTASAPWFRAGWSTLAEMLKYRRATDALRALEARHRAEVGTEPPWL